MTQPELAKRKIISPEMATVAEKEGVTGEFIRQGVEQGNIVILANMQHKNISPCGIGKGLYTKVNANIGTSADWNNPNMELEKLHVAIEAGTDTIMDLSTGGDIIAIRQAIREACSVPLGTVPVYQSGIEMVEMGKAVVDMKTDRLFAVIEQQAKEGVDFVTVHCGVTRRAVEFLKHQHRMTQVVSRGGAFLIGWMLRWDRENPLYEYYDRLLEIAHSYDVTLSLGDGLRPGSLADATDRPQIEELLTLGELVERARDAGVQVMVEGPGHLPLNQIAANVLLEKRVCHDAPFYVLGPLVTDVAAGYDHITAAIGGAVAAAAGADFLCYVTPSEHLALPNVDEVKEGVIATRIAAHAADIAKGVNGALDWDNRMSQARRNLDWEKQFALSMYPSRCSQIRTRSSIPGATCTMCGPFCAMKLVEDYLRTPVA